jgi:MYXO-CTERM domain-containing protein
MRTHGCAAALLGLVAACDVPAYDTEQHQLGLTMKDFTSGNLTKPQPHVDAIVGSRLCAHFDGWYEDAGTFHVEDGDDDGWLRDCFAMAAGGAAQLDGECLVLGAPGEAALELTPRTCPTQQEFNVEFTADRMPISSWAIDDVVLRYDDLFMRMLAEELVPGPAESFPPPALPDPSEPMRAVVGGWFFLPAQPFAKDDALHPVGFDRGTVRVVGQDLRGDLQAQLDEGAIVIEAGDRFALDLEIAAGTLHGSEVVAVDSAEAASIELLVGYERCESCGLGWGAIKLVQAVVRDAEGKRLFLPSVEFHAQGFSAGDTYGDAMFVDGVCEGIAGRQLEGSVLAQYRDLVAAADVRFECPLVADDEPDVVHDDPDTEVPDDDGVFDCACDAGNADPSAAALGLFVIAALRRRRR